MIPPKGAVTRAYFSMDSVYWTLPLATASLPPATPRRFLAASESVAVILAALLVAISLICLNSAWASSNSALYLTRLARNSGTSMFAIKSPAFTEETYVWDDSPHHVVDVHMPSPRYLQPHAIQ